jgi:hypothetical protein
MEISGRRTQAVRHTGGPRGLTKTRERRTDAGFVISQISQAGGSIPPPTATSLRAFAGSAPFGRTGELLAGMPARPLA